MYLAVQDISFGYSVEEVLKQVSFEANAGDLVAIMGQNGSGKSTLLKCIARILKVRRGAIRLDGTPLERIPSNRLSQMLAYLPQMEKWVSDINVFDAVLLGRKPYIGSKPSAKDMTYVAELLRRLDLEGMAMSGLHTLSGGQRQRVFIARALAQEPSLFLLDEPIANLDLKHQMRVMRLLQGLAAEGMTVVLTIHDVNLAARFCNKVLMLKAGEVFAFGVHSVYTPENIARLYDVEVDVLHHKDKICVIPDS